MATKFEKLEDHKKRGVELEHCITSWSKQFSGKIKNHNLKYVLIFMSLNSVEYQQKNLQYLKVL